MKYVTKGRLYIDDQPGEGVADITKWLLGEEGAPEGNAWPVVHGAGSSGVRRPITLECQPMTDADWQALTTALFPPCDVCGKRASVGVYEGVVDDGRLVRWAVCASCAARLVGPRDHEEARSGRN